jgi:phage I-like protein
MALKRVVEVRVSLADSGSASPKWHLLFPLGVTKHRADFPKPISFDAAMLTEMAQNYVEEGKPERAINFFHRGASDVNATIDDKVAAGYFADVVFDESGASPERNAGPGLYVLISWTERARGYILKDELRYLSPEFLTSSTSKNTGKPEGAKLLGAALLSDPFLTELPRVAASENQGAPTVNKELICKALGCKPDCTDEELNAAAAAMCEKMAEVPAKEEAPVKEAPVAEEPKKEEVKAASEQAVTLALAESEAARTSMAERLASLEKQAALLLAEKKAAEVKMFFDTLVREGKCTPALRGGLEVIAMTHGLDAVRFVEKSAPMVKMGELGITGIDESDSKETSAKKFAEVSEALATKHNLSGTEAMRLAARTNKDLANKASATK